MNAPERFLIIDDDPANNLLCKINIQRMVPGASIVSFTVPEEGVDYIQSEYSTSPVETMLFLDINMPTLTGWDVLAEFEKFPHLVNNNITVYILSSSVDPNDKKRAADNPFVQGYIEKPLNKVALQQLLSIPV